MRDVTYIVRPVLFGLFWKVVLHANSYDRRTMSFHLSHYAASSAAVTYRNS
ncbi:hypothetical protein VPHK567_0228 [Vibrio phage K567]